MVVRTFAECATFREAVLETTRDHPCSRDQPWGMIICFDAVTPNNPLASGADLRDMQCIYRAIIELDRLSNESFWFTVAACRSFLAEDELEGGMTIFSREALL